MNADLGSAITRAASRQTYYTIRLLADRERLEDAYLAYAYFRWVDDILDAASGEEGERRAFLERQKSLLEACSRGRPPRDIDMQEEMLLEMVRHDPGRDSGLQLYLRNMMQVMEFDVARRGRLITQRELNEYTHHLAVAVTEAIHYFIGHDEGAPHDAGRYLAVSAAHIIHMLRDTFVDAQLGYCNVPGEVLEANHLCATDVHQEAYRAWVESRVLLAREYFRAGKDYFARVRSWRCRLASFAYMARFEWLLETIAREGYLLRPDYSERKSGRAGLRMAWLTLSSMASLRAAPALAQPAVPHPSGRA